MKARRYPSQTDRSSRQPKCHANHVKNSAQQIPSAQHIPRCKTGRTLGSSIRIWLMFLLRSYIQSRERLVVVRKNELHDYPHQPELEVAQRPERQAGTN